MKNSLFARYLLSAFIFKSVLIGGGYATGRELVEFFLSRGPRSGLVGLGVSAAMFSLILAIAFELARRYRLFDYRSFFKKLLGPVWVLFDLAFLGLLVLVLSVLGAASGEIIQQVFEIPAFLGTTLLVGLIALMVFFGTSVIERFFVVWSLVLYGAFVVFFVWSGVVLGPDIAGRWGAAELIVNSGLRTGVLYASYNLVVIPAILYCARHFTQTKEAVISGVLAGPIAMIPALLFFLVMVSRYPEVNGQHVPIVFMLAQLHSPAFQLAFQGVIFGTLVETGTGLVHGFNERVADVIKQAGREMPAWMRAAIALTLLCVSIALATRVGIVALIAKGYGYSAYAFVALIAIPVLTRGLWLITRQGPA